MINNVLGFFKNKNPNTILFIMKPDIENKMFYTTAWDNKEKTDVDVSDLYRQYCKSMNVKNFSQFNQEEGSVFLKNLINDYHAKLISLSELSALANLYFFEFAINLEGSKEHELSLLLSDADFEMRVNQKTANFWLKEAFEFAQIAQ